MLNCSSVEQGLFHGISAQFADWLKMLTVCLPVVSCNETEAATAAAAAAAAVVT